MSIKRMIGVLMSLALSTAVLAAEAPTAGNQTSGRSTVHPRPAAQSDADRSSSPVLSRRAQSEVKDRRTGSAVRSGE